MQAVKLRQVTLHRISQSQLTFFRQHHDADPGKGLGHGHDLENCVLLHWLRCVNVRHSFGVELNHLAVVKHHGYYSGNCVIVHEGLCCDRNVLQNSFIHISLSQTNRRRYQQSENSSHTRRIIVGMYESNAKIAAHRGGQRPSVLVWPSGNV